MRKLFRYLKPYWFFAILAPLFMVLEVSMDLLQPRLMAKIIDQGVMMGDLALVRATGIKMILIALTGLAGGVGCMILLVMHLSILRQIYGRMSMYGSSNSPLNNWIVSQVVGLLRD